MIIVNDCLKIIDFEGCSIDVNRQILATSGFVIPPYHEFEGYPDRYVKQLYTANQFPDVSRLPLGELMLHCWNGRFQTMAEVIQELEAFQPSAFKRNCKAVTWAVVSLPLVFLVFTT